LLATFKARFVQSSCLGNVVNQVIQKAAGARAKVAIPLVLLLGARRLDEVMAAAIKVPLV
jgi:hypothetical protein